MALHNNLRRFAIISLLVSGAFGLTGCEQISSFLGGSSEKEAVKSENSATQAVTAVATTQPDENAPLAPDVLARVGSWTITIDEFNEKLTKLKSILPEFDPADTNAKRLILEELVRQELMVVDAKARGFDQKKEIVATVDDFRKTLLVQELATELTRDIQATEADAQEYYNANKKNFIVTPEWKVREIVVASENEAKEVLVQLLQGADFADMAKTRSKSSTATKGGDMGYLKKFPFEQMQAAVASLETGKISNVIKGPQGYYLLKLEAKRGGDPRPFSSIKENLVKDLTVKKQQDAVLEHLNKLATKTSIKVNEDFLK